MSCTRRVTGVALALFYVIVLPCHAQGTRHTWLDDAAGGDVTASVSLHDQSAPPQSSPAALAARFKPLPVLPYGSRAKARPLTSVGKIALPASALTGTRNVWGMSLNLDDPSASAGQSLTLLAGADPVSPGAQEGGDGYTTGLAWTRNLDSANGVGLSVLFSQPTQAGTHGQWLARMHSHLKPLPFLPSVRLESEVDMVGGGNSAPGESRANLGSLIKLTGAPDDSFDYQIVLSRFDAGFHPEGFSMQSGREAVTADMHYRFSSNVHLDASTIYAEENFEGTDPYRHRLTTLSLSGPILHAYMPSLSATVKTSSEDNADEQGNTQMVTRRLAMDLAQPLWDGWQSRFGVAMNHVIDNVGVENSVSHGVRLAGNHRLRLGRFSGSIGPGVAWRERNGFNAHQDFEIGAALKLRSRKQTVALNLGYLTQTGLPGVYDDSSIKVGLNYSLHFNDPAPAGDDNAWYLSDAGAF